MSRQIQQFTAMVDREGDRYRSHCPELELFTYGKTVEEAHENLVEAIALFFELADTAEVTARLERYQGITRLAFLLEDDPEDGYRAESLGKAGIGASDSLPDLCDL